VVDPGEVLAKVVELPVSSWRYRARGTHMGPWRRLRGRFGLGSSNSSWRRATWAACAGGHQGPQAAARRQDEQIRELNERLLALEARLAPAGAK